MINHGRDGDQELERLKRRQRHAEIQAGGLMGVGVFTVEFIANSAWLALVAADETDPDTLYCRDMGA